MTVGSLAGQDLQGAAGALFPCRFVRASAGSGDRSVTLGEWTTAISDDGRTVVTSTTMAIPVGDVGPMARLRANEGLDYLSAARLIDAVVSKGDDDYLVWGSDPSSGVTSLRVVGIMRGISELTATVTVHDENGVDITQTPPTPRYHQAMRFVRMARTANARLDSYRNLFLALECLLHDLHPHVRKGKGRQSEGAWFKAALGVSDERVPVSQLAPSDDADAIEWIYEKVYGDFRSGLMHAKDDFHLPADDTRRLELEERFVSLWRYVAALMQAMCDTPGRGSWTSDDLWIHVGEVFFAEVRAAVTNDPEAGEDLTETFAPGGGRVLELPPGEVSYVSHGFNQYLSSCSAQEVRDLGPLTRIGGVSGGQSRTASDLPMPLVVGDSVDVFEVLLGHRDISEGGIITGFDY